MSTFFFFLDPFSRPLDVPSHRHAETEWIVFVSVLPEPQMLSGGDDEQAPAAVLCHRLAYPDDLVRLA